MRELRGIRGSGRSSPRGRSGLSGPALTAGTAGAAGAGDAPGAAAARERAGRVGGVDADVGDRAAAAEHRQLRGSPALRGGPALRGDPALRAAAVRSCGASCRAALALVEQRCAGGGGRHRAGFGPHQPENSTCRSARVDLRTANCLGTNLVAALFAALDSGVAGVAAAGGPRVRPVRGRAAEDVPAGARGGSGHRPGRASACRHLRLLRLRRTPVMTRPARSRQWPSVPGWTADRARPHGKPLLGDEEHSRRRVAAERTAVADPAEHAFARWVGDLRRAIHC